MKSIELRPERVVERAGEVMAAGTARWPARGSS